MSGLAKYFEEEGLSTVCIALVREHAEQIEPPRALWVPYPLGRPFGAPNNAGLQRKIILSAFELLDRTSGPVLEDFPDIEAEPVQETGEEAWVCPVSFPAPRPDPSDRLTPILDEVRALEPWYRQSVETRGRTIVGVSGKSIDEAVRLLFDNGGDLDATVPVPELVDAIRFSADDVKSYYFEAASAQAGTVAKDSIEQWFWNQTEAAGLIRQVRQVCLAHEDQAIQDVGDFMLVPESFV